MLGSACAEFSRRRPDGVVGRVGAPQRAGDPAIVTLMQLGGRHARGFLPAKPVPGGATEAPRSARWKPMPFPVDREALSMGAI